MPIPTSNSRIKKLRRLARSNGVDLWAMDEVHFQQHGSRCRMWIPPEVKDPVLLHSPTRKSVKYFGAVRLRDGRLVYRREAGSFDAATCHAFLRQLRDATRRGRRKVVVIADNAAYHHARLHRSWRAAHAKSFGIYFLPPYSPQLNPIERVWKPTRRRCLHNRYFSQLDAVTDAVECLFADWSSGNHTLRRLCAIS
jgi:transposase